MIKSTKLFTIITASLNIMDMSLIQYDLSPEKCAIKLFGLKWKLPPRQLAKILYVIDLLHEGLWWPKQEHSVEGKCVQFCTLNTFNRSISPQYIQ